MKFTKLQILELVVTIIIWASIFVFMLHLNNFI